MSAEARASGREEKPYARDQGGDREEQPHAQGVVPVPGQEGLEKPSHVESQKGPQEEIPLIQGKEQQLCFAGAAVRRYRHIQGKRNPSKMVGVVRGHQRADTLKLYSEKLVNLITLEPQPCLTQ